jgi:hypothetical protein
MPWETPAFRNLAIVALLLLVALLSACDSGDDGRDATPTPGLEPTTVTSSDAGSGATPSFERETFAIVTSGGISVRLQVEIAETREERALGLMGRRELEADSGMLFLIEPPGRGFWMKDTELPLTVAFIAACGEIVDFADLEPLSLEIKNTQREYLFALEMQRDWFQDKGIAIGDRLELPERLRPSGC